MSKEKNNYMEIGKYVMGLYFLMLLVGISIYMLCGCSSINKKFGLNDDNAAEEIIENLIEQKTGLDIDLTPGTPE